MEQVPGQSLRGSGTIELAVVLRFVDIAVDALAEAREEIDALNVYPVPDGDTGTNMYLTVAAARDALRSATAEEADLLKGLAALRKGALLGARGNSGVILSQMLGALASTIATASSDERNASIMARALREATEGAYAAVGTPVEGTILTVIRAAAEAAEERAAQDGARARDVFTAAAAAAREALARTPELLQVLRDAGVVDAGGRGLSVILDAAETALTGRRPVPVTAPIGAHRIPIPMERDAHALTAERAGVRGDVPPRRRRRPGPGAQGAPRPARRLARRRRRRRPVERARPRGRRRRRGRGGHRGRPSAPHPGHPLRRAGRRGPGEAFHAQRPPGRRRRRRARAGEALRGGRRHGRRRRAGQPPVDRHDPRRHPRLRRAGGDRAPERRGLGPRRARRRPDRRGRRGRPGRGDPDRGAGAGPGRPGGARAGPPLRPGRPRDDRHRAARAARRRHGRGQAGDDDGRAVRARRRARRDRRRLRRRRRRPRHRRERRARSGCSRAAGSW